jgi:hypothetical protein
MSASQVARITGMKHHTYPDSCNVKVIGKDKLQSRVHHEKKKKQHSRKPRSSVEKIWAIPKIERST